MAAVDIDFDLFKQLTMLRSSEHESISDVIRKMVEAFTGEERRAVPASSGGVAFRGIHLPDGTKFRATYKGQTHTAEIKNGHWIDEHGVRRSSPSDAARAVTQTNVNGWRFWHARRPGETEYKLMDVMTS